MNMSVTTGAGGARRPKAFVAVVLAATLLAGCASMIGTRQVVVPLAKLQQGLDKRFPVHHQVLAVFDLELAHPQLALQPAQDRVALTLDVAASSPLLKRALHGSLVVSGHLVVDAARNAVVLDAARIDRFDLDGQDPARQRQFAEAANALAGSMVKDVALYNFRPEDLRYAGMQFVPGRITTTADALVITVDPAK